MEKYGIDCKKIEYVDFTSELVENNGYTAYEGALSFKCTGVSYSVEVVVLETNRGYKLLEIVDWWGI